MERSNLIMDAVYRAKEHNQYIEMDDFMKEVVYGYSESKERNISSPLTPIRYVSASSVDRMGEERNGKCDMPQMPKTPRSNNNCQLPTTYRSGGLQLSSDKISEKSIVKTKINRKEREQAIPPTTYRGRGILACGLDERIAFIRL